MTPNNNGLPVPMPMTKPPGPRRWLWVGLGLVAFIVAVYVGMFFAVGRIQTPHFTSLDGIDEAMIARGELLVIRRPDGGADITAGKTETVTIAASDVDTLLAPLRKANPVNTARGVWMGKLVLYFQDGRKLDVLLYSVGESANGPMRYKIDEYQYEVDSVTPFLKAIDAVDAKLKSKK